MITVTIVSAAKPLVAVWACLVEADDGQHQLSDVLPANTQHEALLKGTLAILEECMSDEICVRSNSEFLIKGMNRNLAGWIANGWRTASRQPVMYEPLWRQITVACRTFDHVTWQFAPNGSDWRLKDLQDVTRELLESML